MLLSRDTSLFCKEILMYGMLFCYILWKYHEHIFVVLYSKICNSVKQSVFGHPWVVLDTIYITVSTQLIDNK
jgi:hypothetical protein